MEDPQNCPCDICRGEIDTLRKALGAATDENRRLREELHLLGDVVSSMRRALTGSRDVIVSLQATREHAYRFPWKIRLAFQKRRQVASTLKSYLPTKSEKPKYMQRSDLEWLICHAARIKVHNIGGVILDFKQAYVEGEGSNWRVSGIISGRADQDTASEAIRHASVGYAAWVMVEDGSALNGKTIRRKELNPRMKSNALSGFTEV